MLYAKIATLVNYNCFKFESAVKIPLEALSCAFALAVCGLCGHRHLSVGVWPRGRPGEPAPQYNAVYLMRRPHAKLMWTSRSRGVHSEHARISSCLRCATVHFCVCETIL